MWFCGVNPSLMKKSSTECRDDDKEAKGVEIQNPREKKRHGHLFCYVPNKHSSFNHPWKEQWKAKGS